jgi:hypothetical protein
MRRLLGDNHIASPKCAMQLLVSAALCRRAALSEQVIPGLVFTWVARHCSLLAHDDSENVLAGDDQTRPGTALLRGTDKHVG